MEIFCRMRRTFHLVLAISLLFLSGLQIAHELDLHAHKLGHACEMCLFTGHLAHGAPSTIATLKPVHSQYAFFSISLYRTPLINRQFRSDLTEHAPPSRVCIA